MMVDNLCLTVDGRMIKNARAREGRSRGGIADHPARPERVVRLGRYRIRGAAIVPFT